MAWKKLVSLVVVSVLTSVAAAEEPGIDSPEAVKALCDEAMPALLIGEANDAGGMARFASEPTFAAFAYDYRRKFERMAPEVGAPMDWKYVGEKRGGDSFRQFFYVCRYSIKPIVWRVTAMEKDGRWFLTNMQYDSNMPAIVAIARGDGPKNGECTQLCEQIVRSLAEGKEETRQMVRDSLAPRLPPGDTRLDQLFDAALGKIKASQRVQWKPLHGKDVAGVLGEYWYLVQADEGWFTVQLLTYRQKDAWKLLFLSFTGNVDEALGAVAFDPAKSPDESQTARAPSERSDGLK